MKGRTRSNETPSLDLPEKYLTRDLSGGTQSLVAGQGKTDGRDTREVIAELLRPAKKRGTDPRDLKIKELENRLALLETTVPKYRDVWERGRVYQYGDQVTFSGALWIVRSAGPTSDRPGTSGAWKLQTKTKDR